MINSFRLRLALLSALLTGFTLVVLILSALWLIHDIKIKHIDDEVRTNAERESSRTRSADDWRRIEDDLASNLGVRDSRDLLFLVEDGVGQIIYRSPHWPSGLDTASLPWPKQNLRPMTTSNHGLKLISEVGAADQPLEPPPPRDPEYLPPGTPPISSFISRDLDGHIWHIGLASTDRSRVAIGINANIIDGEMKSIRNALYVSLPLILILIGGGGWVFSSRAMRPLKKLIAATQRVTTEGLDQRISDQGEDREFVELIEVYNHMLAELAKKQGELERMAHHDVLTGLPNRILLADRMQQALARARRSNNRIALLFMDLDGFKPINDKLGHEAGDEALKEVSRRLLEVIRKADTLARVGGDEFVLLAADLENLIDDRARTLATKCLDAVSKPMALRGAVCNLGVSIRIAFSDGKSSADTLLAAADKAMYEAKQKGRGCYVMAPYES
ncbi:MAG: sensor domain-containing diguanylate cyclase [Deltaproteobacteria bacterium]